MSNSSSAEPEAAENSVEDAESAEAVSAVPKFAFGKIFKSLLAVLLLAGFAIAYWGFFVEPDLLITRNYDLKVKNWSPTLNNFKIAVITDVHGGANFIDEAKIRQVVTKTNRENPDIIVLLGDYVSQQRFDRSKLKMPMATIAENLRGLQAKYGVYAVLGNHDGWYDNKEVRRELENCGYRVLNNEAVAIKKNGETLRILGIADVLQNGNWGQNNEAAITALDKLESKDGKILMLTHNPDALNYLTLNQSVSPDAVLFLAGHTHGGQISLPLIGALKVPTEFGRRYARGFIRDRGIDIFISPGIGTSILPVRIGVPPEISVLSVEAE